MKRWRIDLLVNTSQAESAARGATAAMGNVEKAAERAAKAAEAQAERQAKALDRAADRATRAADRAADAAVKAADRLAAKHERDAERQAKLEDAKADKATRAADRAADAAAKAAERQSAKQQREADRQAAAADRAADKATRAADRAADAAVKAAERAAERQAKALDAAADKATRSADRAADQAANAAERAARRAVAAKEAEVARITGANVRAWTDAEITAKVANEKIRRANWDRYADALKGEGLIARYFKNGWEGANMLAVETVKAGAAFLTLHAATSIVKTIAGMYEWTAKAATDAAKATTGFQEKLLELAALKDRLGGTTTENKEQLIFRAKTLQSADQARAFQSAAIGAGEAFIDKDGVTKLVDPAEQKRFMEMAGAFQATEGGEAKTHGELTGMMPSLMGKKRATAEEMFAKEAHLYQIMKPGRGGFSDLTSGIMKNSSMVAAGLMTIEQLTALESAMSLPVGTEHAAVTEEFVRATSGAIGRAKGPKFEGDSMKVGTYLKSLHATPGMDPLEIGKRISTDLKAKQEEAARTGKPFSIPNYLLSRGYGNMKDAAALQHFHGLYQSGTFKSSFEDVAGKPASATETLRDVAAFQAANPVAQERKAAIAGDIATTVRGGGPNQTYTNAMKNAFEQLRTKGVLSGNYEENVTGAWGVYAEPLIAKHAQENLLAEGRKHGLTDDAMYKNTMRTKSMGMYNIPLLMDTREGRAEQLYKLSAQVGAAGGDITPGMGKLIEALERNTAAHEAVEKRIAAGRAAPPGPLPAGPAAMGAPVRP